MNVIKSKNSKNITGKQITRDFVKAIKYLFYEKKNCVYNYKFENMKYIL